MRKLTLAITVAAFLALACMPAAGEITSATDQELDRACTVLRGVGYDYWRLNAVGGRTLEVAADIHTAHSGPEQTRKYCEGR